MEEVISTDLIEVKNLSVVELFTKNEMDQLLEKLTSEVTKFVPDLTTKKGRDEIASLAYKVAKSKTYLDDKGKELVEGQKKSIKLVDDVRKEMRERLDKLRDEVRKPLTDWENLEKNRVLNLENGIKEIQKLGMIANQGMGLGLATLKASLTQLQTYNLTPENWQEFHAKAKSEHAGAVATVEVRIKELEQYEADQAELKRLKAEEEVRKKKEHEEQIAARAREEAEAKAKRDREAADAKAKHELEQSKLAEQAALDNQKRAEEAAKVEKERADKAIAKAKADKEAADIKAEADKKKAAEDAAANERRLAQEQKDRDEAEKKKREADVEHRKSINREAMAAIQKVVEAGYADELNAEALSKEIIIALVKNQVPHIKITY